LLHSAARVFEGAGKKPSAREQRQAAELVRLRGVTAEITAENLEL
jgi:hypothetical protein